ncbi:MAG: Hsp33 family molecular chaperone HslO [Polyangia bacterium]
MSTRDQIARGLLDGGTARVVGVTATDVVREAARRHRATGAAAVALGRGLAAGLLLATLTKDDERLTLQILGDGPLGSLTVDSSAAGTARGYVKSPGARLPPAAPGARIELAAAVGRSGLVSVVRDLGLRENFGGQTPIVSGEIDEDVEHYLNTSEQIDSALACEAVVDGNGNVVAAAGILIQALPGSAAGTHLQTARTHLRAGGLTSAAAACAPEGNVDGLIAQVLGATLGTVQLLEVRGVRFYCPCSRERAGGSLALLGQAELAQLILDDGRAEVTCNFCRERYEFTEAELETIRRELDKTAGLPS